MTTSSSPKTRIGLAPRGSLVGLAAGLLVALGAAYNVFGLRQLVVSNAPDVAVDLKMRWIDNRYIARGQNPYDVLLASKGIATSDPSACQIAEDIGPPLDGGYFPWSFAISLLFAPPVSFAWARCWMAMLNVAALSIIGGWLWKGGLVPNRAGRCLLIGSALAVVSNLFAISAGQYTLLVNACLVLALVFHSARADALAGLAMAAACVKPQIAVPFLAVMLVCRRWISLAVCGGLLATTSIGLSVWAGSSPWEMVQQALRASQLWVTRTLSYDLLALVYRTGAEGEHWVTLVAACSLALGTVLLYALRKQPPLLLFAVASVVGRLWTYHGYYDNAMLLFLLVQAGVIALRLRTWFSAVVFVAVGATLWLPLRYEQHSWLALQLAHVAIWTAGAGGVVVLALRLPTESGRQVVRSRRPLARTGRAEAHARGNQRSSIPAGKRRLTGRAESIQRTPKP